jgi:hypothetical protein
MSTSTVRFVAEMALAILFALLTIATAVYKSWIEFVFGVDPDRGSGALEWLIVATAAIACLAFARRATLVWKRELQAQE